MASSSDTALKTFSLTNDIIEISPQDEIYKYDVEANKRLIREQPWTSE
jgi:COP9 signalosome complex subunit 5